MAARERQGGLTLLEIMVVLVITGVLSAIAAQEYQQYQYRARAAGIVVESAPIRRAIGVYMNTVGQGQDKPQLANGTDRSILGAGAGPVTLVVAADQLLLSKGTVRVTAALCELDCPSYALHYSSDLNTTGTGPVVAPPGGPAGGGPAGGGSAPSADFQHINRVLYEFGEVMRKRERSSDNAGCLNTTDPCTVTIKYGR